MESRDIKKMTYKINLTILLIVFWLMAFFALAHARLLVWFSIPTVLIYVIGFYLIAKNKYGLYVRMVYSWITLYMMITTICLGYRTGFHLYSMSMIPIVFYTEYMAYKMRIDKVSTTFYSILVIAVNLVSAAHSVFMPPVYEVDNRIAAALLITNSLIVMCLLAYYSRYLIRRIIASDRQLSERANRDRLTHLFNRNYMMERLKEAYEDDKQYYIAMIDVDNFKSINDSYGHQAGDEVLRRVAATMEEVCKDSIVSRWGGEEFLILTHEGTEIIEKLRQAVEKLDIDFDGKNIKVTMTAGIEPKDRSIAINKWVVAADEKLYIGKNSGKNRVI